MMSEGGNPKVYSVAELTQEIQDLLGDHFDFVWVEGEISNFSAPVSGHYYMVLKDEAAQIRAVMFRLQARHLRFRPENGMKVIAQGRIGVYAPRGEYQIILDYLEPMGVGALAIAFEQLKRKLSDQGVFDQALKRPLPFLPQRIAVITSPTGAAIRDFLKIIHRRFANLEITVVPVRVQGEGASADMVRALDTVNRELAVDVIVLTRGGGSFEDLWAFNQEELALAIRRSRIPVVSAVGHEVDLTISDLAADFRAATPSAAAELLVVEKEGLTSRLQEARDRIIAAATQKVEEGEKDLNRLVRGLQDPRKRLADMWMRMDELLSRALRGMDLVMGTCGHRLSNESRALVLNSPVNRVAALKQRLEFQQISLSRGMFGRLRDTRGALSLFEKRIRDLSPLWVLKRGYSITRRLPEKRVVTDASSVGKGDPIQVLLWKGELDCRIETVRRGPKR
jgi:exodeoxyribonuclease VII large subunit